MEGRRGDLGGCIVGGLLSAVLVPIVVVLCTLAWFTLIVECSDDPAAWGPIGLECEWRASAARLTLFSLLCMALAGGYAALMWALCTRPRSKSTKPPGELIELLVAQRASHAIGAEEYETKLRDLEWFEVQWQRGVISYKKYRSAIATLLGEGPEP